MNWNQEVSLKGYVKNEHAGTFAHNPLVTLVSWMSSNSMESENNTLLIGKLQRERGGKEKG